MEQHVRDWTDMLLDAYYTGTPRNWTQAEASTLEVFGCIVTGQEA